VLNRFGLFGTNHSPRYTEPQETWRLSTIYEGTPSKNR